MNNLLSETICHDNFNISCRVNVIMQELLIVWDDETEMFYHDYFCSSLFADVLEHLIEKFKLNGRLEQSESYTLHKLNYLNSDNFVIKLVDEFNQELPLF